MASAISGPVTLGKLSGTYMSSEIVLFVRVSNSLLSGPIFHKRSNISQEDFALIPHNGNRGCAAFLATARGSLSIAEIVQGPR